MKTELIISMKEFKVLHDFMPGWNVPTGTDDSTTLDWNTFMPVVEKIESIQICGFEFEVDTSRLHCRITSIVRPTGKKHLAFNGLGITKIEAVYKAVIEFIKWYNSQKK